MNPQTLSPQTVSVVTDTKNPLTTKVEILQQQPIFTGTVQDIDDKIAVLTKLTTEATQQVTDLQSKIDTLNGYKTAIQLQLK